MERAEGVAISSVVVSAVIVAVKLFVALVTGSMAVLGELLYSLGDILTSSVTLMGIRLSRKPPDADHPYGHAKFDSLLGLLSSIFLMEVEAYVIFRSISALLGPLIPPSVINETLLLLTATSLVNVARSLALWRTGGSEGVRMMQSEAINYGWDAARTLVVVGVLLISKEVPLVDPLAALLVTVLVVPSTLRVAYWSASDLLDRIDPKLLARIYSLLGSCREIVAVRMVRARKLGKIALVDAVIEVDPSITAERTNEIIRRIEDRIRVEIGPSEVMIVPLASGRSRESVAKEVTESVEGVREAHTLEFYGERGERLHLHVVLGDDINLKRANEIAKEVESRLKRALGVKEVIVHVDHSGEGVPLEEIRERIEELRDVRWASVETVRSGSCVRLEIRVGADPEMRAREINRLQHDVMAIAAELAPKAKVSVRVVPAC